MVKYKVSVILPVYNGEKTLATTLESLVNQTFKDFELVCCIDGTNDESENIINLFRDKFNKLTILKNQLNRGLGATMNRLMSNTNGEYIAIAEQDDYYYTTRLEKQVKVLDDNDAIGLVSGIADFWNGEKIVMQFPGILVARKQYPKGKEMFLLNYKKQVKVANSCTMIRKSVHVNNGLYFSVHFPSISVDWTYIMRFSLLSDIYGLHVPLVRLDRRNDRNSVTSNKNKQFLAAREVIRSFKYEFAEIITSNDYKFSLMTEYIIELNNASNIKYCFLFVKNFIFSPFDKRLYISFNKRILKKLFK